MKFLLDTEKLRKELLKQATEHRGEYLLQCARIMCQGKSTPFAKEYNPRSAAAVGPYTQIFEDFWRAYPKKNGKGGAFRLWKSIAKKEDEEEIFVSCMTALKWQKPLWEKDDNKFVPMPETYLSKRRWEDEPVATHKTERYMDHDGRWRER